MERRDFLRLAGILGLGAVVGCGSEPDVTSGSYDGTVLVIGAGAAGKSAAPELARAGVEVTVLEAAETHGGRIKTARDFVDFPVPLGGEWLHTDAEVLQGLTGLEQPGIQMAGYGETESYGSFDAGALTVTDIEGSADLKFVGRTWLDVFDEFIVPTIADRFRFGVEVASIDHGGDRVVVTATDGTTHEADKVIVTAPITAVRDRITFVPDLPDDRRETLDAAKVWGGFKAFIEFEERFYPGLVEIAGRSGDDGQHLYYDAAHGQDTDRHVLGLFTVGTGSEPYQAALARGELQEVILGELDEVFDGAASANYLQHIAQDWSAEPHIGMAYLADDADWQTPRKLAEPIGDRVYFAGDAYIDDGEDGWSMVHLAAKAGRVAVDDILV
ncbi:MAG: FAD-dependent oxidoreductase [Actinomycetota bacterium]